MTTILGIALGLLSAVFFGIYMVPRKLVHTSNHVFLMSMVCGMAPAALAVQWLFPDAPWPSAMQLFWTTLGGLIWVMAVFWFAMSVRHLGLAAATTIKNTTAVWGTLIGLAVFAEHLDTRWIPAVAGSVCVVLAACFIDRLSRDSQNGRTSHMDATGILLAIGASLGFAIYAIPVRMVMGEGLAHVRILPGVALGAILGVGSAVLLNPKERRAFLTQGSRSFLLSVIGGVIWSVATLWLMIGISLVGLAVSWPLSNINTVFAATIGAVWFREINLRAKGPVFATALAIAVLGVGLLAWSRM